MQLEGVRIMIMDGTIFSGSVGRVVSHADGRIAVTIEKGVGRDMTVALADRHIMPVFSFDGARVGDKVSAAGEVL